MSYLAKFSNYKNGEERFFHKWVNSDIIYNHMKQDHAKMSVHNTLMQKIDDEHLKGSGSVLQFIVNVKLESFKVDDI